MSTEPTETPTVDGIIDMVTESNAGGNTESPDTKVTDEAPLTTLDHIVERIDRLEAKFDNVVSMVEKLIANVEPYIKDIAPMIDAVANNPMFKMFTGTKGKEKTNGAR